MHSKTQKSSYTSGLIAEWRARWFLRFHGFRILKSRYITGMHTNRAEIDIIAKRGNLILFCEVKKRPCIIDGLNSVTPSQSMRLRLAAETYLSQKYWTGNARFDVIIICKSKLHWIQNAI